MDHHANNFKKTYCNNLFQDNFCKFIIYAKITSTECRITQKWNYSLKISRINNVGYNKIQRLIWIIPVASVYLSNIMRVVVVCWFLFSTRLTETQHNGRSTQLLPLSQSMQGYWIQYFWTLYCFFTHLLFGQRVFLFCTSTILSTYLIISTEGWLGICNISCRPTLATISKGPAIVWIMLVIIKHTFTPRV